jgi:hypothetical protein
MANKRATQKRRLLEDGLMKVLDIDVWTDRFHRSRCHLSLRLADVLFAKQELTIEIANVDCVQIDLEKTILDKVRLTQDRKCTKRERLTTVIFLKPVKARFLSSSHPIPPAPMTSTLHSKAFRKSEFRQVILLLSSYEFVLPEK